MRPSSKASVAERFAWAPMLLGAAALAWILAAISGPYFFSVDGGAKLLGVEHLLGEGYAPGFAAPSAEWAAQLWAGEAFPFRPPFALASDDGWQLAFALPFLALSAPLYAVFGWPGLYVLPIAATLGTWALVWRRSQAHPQRLAVVAVAVGSFATPYGATFWEHNLALVLATFSLFEASPSSEAPASTRNSVVRGAALAAAGFLRPEAWVLGAAVVVARARKSRGFALAFVAGACVFALHNVVVYQHPLGAHAAQLGATVSASAGTTGQSYAEILSALATELFTHSPALWALLGGLVLVRTRTGPSPFRALQSELLALVLFVAVLPVVLPNGGGRQWGPRYLIVVLPLLWTVVCKLSDDRDSHQDSETQSSPGRRVGWALAVAGMAGLGLNVIYGATMFRRAYTNDVARLVEALEVVEPDAVAITVPLQAGELAGYKDRWPYVLAASPEALSKVAAAAPPAVARIAWILPSAPGPAGSSFAIPGERPMSCQAQGFALAAHYIVRCELEAPASAAPHSTGE